MLLAEDIMLKLTHVKYANNNDNNNTQKSYTNTSNVSITF